MMNFGSLVNEYFNRCKSCLCGVNVSAQGDIEKAGCFGGNVEGEKGEREVELGDSRHQMVGCWPFQYQLRASNSLFERHVELVKGILMGSATGLFLVTISCAGVVLKRLSQGEEVPGVVLWVLCVSAFVGWLLVGWLKYLLMKYQVE